MLSFARNERGIRLASAALLLLPLVSLICATSRSAVVDLAVIVPYLGFAVFALIAFLSEQAEEEDMDNK